MFILIAWILGIATLGTPVAADLTKTMLVATILFSVITTALHFYLFKNTYSKVKWLCQICWVFTVFLCAIFYAQASFEKRLALVERIPRQVQVVAFAAQMDELTAQGSKQVVQIYSSKHAQPVNWLARVKISSVHSSESALKIGHYYLLTGKVHPAHSYVVDGVFDQEKWYLQQNLQANIQVEAIQEISELQALALTQPQFIQSHKTWWVRFKMAIEKERLNQRLFIQAQPFAQKGLLLALLTGDESLLNSDTEQKFQALGISHLLAISGPHVLIFSAMLCWFLHRLIIRFCPQLYLRYSKPFLLSLPFLFGVLFYSAFVGFEIPAWRTLLTTSIMVASLWLYQRISPIMILLNSAALMLYLDPFSLWSAGFWLSYGACFILLRIYQTCLQQPSHALLNWQAKVRFYGGLAIQSQWKIFLGLLPLTLLFFKKVSWLAPLANLLAVPWMGAVIVPLDIFAALVSWFSPVLGLGVYQIVQWNLQALVWCLDVLYAIPNTFQWSHFTPWQLFFIAIGLIILFLPRGVLPKTWAMLCCLPLLLPNKTLSDFEFQVLDVGQGQALYVQQQDQTLLIDTGGKYQEQILGIGQYVLLPFFSQQGISRLDQIILTHLDIDHSGALSSIAPEIKIGSLMANENPHLDISIPFQYCLAGQKFVQHHLTIHVLSPLPSDLVAVPQQRNELSCVLYLQYQHAKGSFNVLVMGDAGQLAEQRILQDYPHLKVDVLLLGHHGSRHSSSSQFLKQLHPKIAIASAGFDNRYRHPSIEVKKHLQNLNIPLYNTAELGSIRFRINASGELQQQNLRELKPWLGGFH
ncbi:DNA internalization-related competence protein ComEC/Rec2 [Acinetobacter sp. MD2(2019)]|uniref:DNA internalization-related competence protein ComEC/Rec2 n=1 Tax=Acinetobacter sp. MD2(2019) TaxID=2605273 RepID=UPI002D1F5BAA|nr:DNA internalization-related competence protein ComEC/Rec2 [Acinetobacter sp. MD2(2019)]MEB3753471.1 DNA internalization-related competence protein ComEC/Rec2 [Acinetobacter sp. MD2(2019)]